MKRSLKYIDQYIVKSGSHLARKLFVLCFNEVPLKMIKYVFHFMLKALFALKKFIVASYFFVYVKKRIVKKSATSQPGLWIITIHILPNISRSKNNQTRKIGKLIEYNVRNTVREKSYIICRARATGKWGEGCVSLTPALFSQAKN